MVNRINYAKLGAVLKKHRLDKGITIKELAETLSYTVQAVYRYEEGSRKISLEILMDICSYMGESIDLILEEVG